MIVVDNNAILHQTVQSIHFIPYPGSHGLCGVSSGIIQALQARNCGLGADSAGVDGFFEVAAIFGNNVEQNPRQENVRGESDGRSEVPASLALSSRGMDI